MTQPDDQRAGALADEAATELGAPDDPPDDPDAIDTGDHTEVPPDQQGDADDDPPNDDADDDLTDVGEGDPDVDIDADEEGGAP